MRYTLRNSKESKPDAVAFVRDRMKGLGPAVAGGVKGWDEAPDCIYCGSDNTEFTGRGVK